MPLFGRPHQRGRAAQFLRRVHVGAGGDQQLDGNRVPVARGEHHHHLAVGKALVRIGAGFQQLFDDRRVAIKRCHRERREALPVGGVHLRAGGDEEIGALEVVAIDGPVQRGRAVGLRGVDVGVLLEQRAQRGSVALHHGVGDITLAGRAAKPRHTDHDGCHGEKHSTSVHRNHLRSRP